MSKSRNKWLPTILSVERFLVEGCRIARSGDGVWSIVNTRGVAVVKGIGLRDLFVEAHRILPPRAEGYTYPGPLMLDVLHHLSTGGSIASTARAIGRHRDAVARYIGELRRRGWVQPKMSRSGIRIVGYSLTETGRRIVHEIRGDEHGAR